ncbi:MAG: hypothetical protein KBS63_01480 [Clostridiales bacterium]|nr:hypothetical protein [Candidatus Crickella caballi]
MELRRKCTYIIIVVNAISLFVATSYYSNMVTGLIGALNGWFTVAFLISNFRIIAEDNKEFAKKIGKRR